jgi:molybdopterin-guanine dinucleotide biosynthesis protein B
MAMGSSTSILQIVGYQNSGKTTVTEKLISALTKEGMKVGSIKHHGHGGKPDTVKPQKDSSRHKAAGAAVSAVEGGGTLQICAASTEWTLEDILSLYKVLSVDAVIVEGYKRAPYPKVVLLRSEEDIELLQQLSHIVGVISWVPLSTEIRSSYKTFHITEESAYLSWLVKTVRDEHV